MRRTNAGIVAGGLLVIFGILLLLQNFGIAGFAWGMLWALLFAAGGIAFVAVFASNQQNWWAVIPGFTLLGLAALIGMDTVFPGLSGVLSGGLFLGAIALSFWVVYLVRRENWWAIIPAGVLTTLAVVATASPLAGESESGGFVMGGLFFLGLAATFALVYVLPTPEGRMRWAMIPAAVLGIMGVLLLLGAGGLINYLWPLALILGGIYVVFRAFTRPHNM